MSVNEKGPASRDVAQTPPLVIALNQSEQIKDKIEECAQDLSSINEVLKEEIIQHLPMEQVVQALHKSEEVEDKVQESADELSLVNQALSEEIRERRKLERKLAVSQIELADTQAELSDTQDQERRVRHLAFHDVVTGLPNRKLFSDRLKIALAQARRHEWCLAVMFIDLDKFKGINDSHGHAVGDKLLKIVSQRLQALVRSADSIGRQGGDEFVYLMLEVKGKPDVESAAGKIFENISQSCEIDGLKLMIRPSIGIALYPEDGRSAHVLIKNADSAMYKAKQSDAGYCFYGTPRSD